MAGDARTPSVSRLAQLLAIPGEDGRAVRLLRPGELQASHGMATEDANTRWQTFHSATTSRPCVPYESMMQLRTSSYLKLTIEGVRLA